MNNEEEKTKKRLINAVLSLLLKKSSHNLTIREIASEANVNSAAISYYFGSKENLLLQASQFYWKEWSELITKLQQCKEKKKDKLRVYLYNYLDFILKYDGIFKRYIAEVITQTDNNSQTAQNLKILIEIVKLNIKEITNIEDEQILNFNTIAMLSAIVYPALLGNYSAEIMQVDIYDKELRNKYIDHLIKTFLHI
ncbi:TetR/AcrR family transcriptional regulator [Oscillospiraceae bacterium PP1C4]